MLYENLQVSKDDERIFDDLKYKINYNHDVQKSLEEEYENIRKKYLRRIERFRKEIETPTCFVRGVWNMEELSQIYENESKIVSVIKKYPDNEIIFVVPRYIYKQNPVKIKQRIFLVDTTINGFVLGNDEGRCFFDTNVELINFCINNYRNEKRKDNIIFDLKAELKAVKDAKEANSIAREMKGLKKRIIRLQENLNQAEQRNYRWMRLLNTDMDTISFPDKISIYGCGAIGKIFYQRIKGYCAVEEFIDRLPRQESYDGIPVVTVKESKADREVEIVVIPSYDFYNIVDNLTKQYRFKPKIITLEEFLAQGRVVDQNF